jgi:hypothetical protein
MWGHVVVLRRSTKPDDATTYIPIEICCIALVVAAADVYLLAVSHRFPVALRDAVRVVGGLVAAGILIWLGSLIVATAIGVVIQALVDDSIGTSGARLAVPRVAVALIGVAAGIGDGALVAVYGPITLASMVFVLVLAGYLRLSAGYRRRRHGVSSLVTTFLCCYAVSGALAASYVLTRS